MAVKLLLVLSLAVVAVSSAGILETLLSWDLHDTEGRSSAPQPKCICQVKGCLCCVDLPLAAGIDVVRPACVNINQINNNVTLNLNYGDNPVHNATIKIDDAANKPTCMNLLANLAQLCAKFSSIKRQASGHTGCLVLEPVFMGSPQDTYSMGCFNFNQTVRQIEVPPTVEPPTKVAESPDSQSASEAEQNDDEEDDGLNTEDLLAAVSESAEQSFALFSRWLGMKFNPKSNATSNNNNNQEAEVEPSSRQETVNTSATSARSSRGMMLDAQTPSHEEKSDERFKQLLSAQDNVLKGSEMIGSTNGEKTTFVYTQLSDNQQNRKEILPVVPRESRRGGRAYNIHQHINEI